MRALALTLALLAGCAAPCPCQDPRRAVELEAYYTLGAQHGRSAAVREIQEQLAKRSSVAPVASPAR